MPMDFRRGALEIQASKGEIDRIERRKKGNEKENLPSRAPKSEVSEGLVIKTRGRKVLEARGEGERMKKSAGRAIYDVKKGGEVG